MRVYLAKGNIWALKKVRTDGALLSNTFASNTKYMKIKGNSI